MDKLNRKNIFNVIFLLCFVGMVLSFSTFFYMSGAMYSAEENEGEFFNETYGIDDSDLYSYDARFMKNTTLHSMIVEAEYKMFGNITQGDIVKGKHGFIFDFGKNQYGYDYSADYLGNSLMTEEELSEFAEAIALRHKVYAEQGRYYILAVIPNSQTVYSEYLPRYLTSDGGKTMLSQLSGYMRENEIGGFVDLTGYIKASKRHGVLYNNTENSVNALGAYFIYNAIMSELPEDIVSPERKLKYTDFSYYTHYTEGKSFAVSAGLKELIKNETVSMSNSTEFKYTVIDHSENLATTYVKAAYKDDVSLKPTVLIDCSSEWDKIQLMPYFSNTFGVSSYRIGHAYDSEAMAEVNPLVVVQTVHEDELYYLLDRSVNRTYQNAAGQEATAYKTNLPRQVEYTVIDDQSVCISGIVESDAEVRAFGEGFEPVSVKPIDGRFFIKVSIEGSIIGKEIFIDAMAEDKAASDHISLIVSGINNVGSARDVAVGSDNSMLYKSDYNISIDSPTENELNEYRVRLFDFFSGVKDVSANFDMQILFVTVPLKPSVYAEGLPQSLLTQKSRLDENKAIFSEMLERAAIKYSDLSLVLSERAKDEKMFYQTDDVLTDAAYYYMYCDIMNRLAESSPQYADMLAPVKAEGFIEYSIPVTNGILASSLGYSSGTVTERVAGLKFTGSTYVVDNGDGSYVYNGSNDDLPKAVIVYDVESEPLVGLIAEHFQYTYVVKSGSDIPSNMLSSVQPDFIIYIGDESKLDFSLNY